MYILQRKSFPLFRQRHANEQRIVRVIITALKIILLINIHMSLIKDLLLWLFTNLRTAKYFFRSKRATETRREQTISIMSF